MAEAKTFLRADLDAETAGHHTYALVSDGDMQEPIFLGSAALFGQWGLGRLIVYYGSNKIQLAGPTCRADCVEYKALFESMHWLDHRNRRPRPQRNPQGHPGRPGRDDPTTMIITQTTKGCATHSLILRGKTGTIRATPPPTSGTS